MSLATPPPTPTYSAEQVYGPIPLSDEEFDTILDQSLSPRPSTMLADKMGKLGLSAQHALLDIGCRDAAHTLRLVERHGCSLLGIDPLAYHIELAQALINECGLGTKATVQQGVIEAIPTQDGTIDFIWCRDMLNHVTDLDSAFTECYRVLKPGGQMLIYVTLATELLSSSDAERLYPPLAIQPLAMDPQNIEKALGDAGFQRLEKDQIGSEWRENWEEDGTHITSQQLLRVARMLRNREAYVDQLGLAPYETELANCKWGIYQMLGKLCPTLYVLEKPA